MAKINTAPVKRQVSRRDGQLTCRSSRQALTKYLGANQRNGRKMVDRTLPVVRPTADPAGFGDASGLAWTRSRLVGALRSLFFRSAIDLSFNTKNLLL